MSKLFWLRDEKKLNERRTPLVPQNAKKLIQAGHEVVVESSNERIFKDDEYQDVGCKIVPSWSWKDAPKNAIIFGLKELPSNEDFPLEHTHIHFAHVFKGQEGSKEVLSRFKKGGGLLLDLEYLASNEGRRIAAFGHWAGFAGAGVAIDGFCSIEGQEAISPLSHYDNQSDYINYLKSKLKTKPRVLIIGALGRCGKGATELLNHLGIEPTKWDYNETKSGGPFKEILEHDIFINAALIMKKIPPFLNKDILNEEQPLKVIADVSCDPNSDLNPIPIYNNSTTWKKPFLEIEHGLHILSVDNLPSMLPRESSIDFSDQLMPYLLGFGSGEDMEVWDNARSSFEKASQI